MLSAIDRHRQYLAGDFNLTDSIEEYLSTIENKTSLNAFIEVYGEEARVRARELDQKRDAGENLGKLAGVVVAVKDNICIKDKRVTCASRMLENYISPFHATVIEKILKEDGLIIGKTNLDEFAMGSSTENTYFGVAHNPHQPEHVAGGSSGGSAIAVATGMADLALGSDTGGSIRQPAAFCGITGLKPTYGRVSRYGLVAFASSLDQIGPMGRTVADTALGLTVISGHDPKDATSVLEPVPDFTGHVGRDISSLRIGLPRQFFGEGLDSEIQEQISHVVEKLKTNGNPIVEIDLPLTEYAIATYYIIATAEASSNLARYDGVRYGYRSPNAEDLESMYVNTRSEAFGKEVKRRLMLGTYVLSAGYYDAYYRKAQKVRRMIQEEYAENFSKVDLILTPTTPTPAFKLGEKLDDPLQMYLSDIYTVTANLGGYCAISIPCGKSSGGLPIGVQLIANAFREDLLIKVGSFIEQQVSNRF